jgi:molecular chaperone DnaK
MYLGIDLGTSNSAIVVNRSSKLELCKTVSGDDVLASVVMRDRTGSRYVGKRAYDQMQVAPKGIAARFKRLLGTDTMLPFGDSEDVISPEEASAEVLRQLLKQVHARMGDVEIEGTVITVPAAFNQMQSEATIRAAVAAGIGKVGLLQEPIAAALACLERPGPKTGLFLIYDLGGGTFDVALVRAIDGAVSIEAHEGINMLGGTDFDRTLVDKLVRPWLYKTFSLPAKLHEHQEYKRLLALATANAELCKIELSSASEAVIFVSEQDARTTDLNGKSLYVEIVVKREEFEALLSEKIAESIALCRKVVADNGYTPGDINRVMLIGGPSRMPIVRRHVRQELGIDVDLDIDPMTAVVRGAAIYAESRNWSGEESTGKDSRVRHDAGADISYDFETRTSRDRARIRVVAANDATGLRVTAIANDGRDYGERLVSESPVFSVELGQGETRVAMTVVREDGSRVNDACTELVITQVAAVAAGAPCTSTIAVKVEDSDGVRAINVLEPLATKGDVLPLKGTKMLRAGRQINPGAAEWIDIELFEQAEGVPEPEANLLVGSFRLSGEDLPAHGRPLRAGEQVVLHWSINDSQLIRCSIELPDHGLHLRDHSFYADDIAKIDFATCGRAYATDALVAVDARFDKVADVLERHCADKLVSLRSRLNTQFERLEMADDADTFRSIAEEARLAGQEVTRLSYRPELRQAVLQGELEIADRQIRYLSSEMMADDVVLVNRHRNTAEQALADGRFQVAKRAIEAIDSVRFRVLQNLPDFIMGIFQHVRTQRHISIDPARFDSLVRRGEAACAARDVATMRHVISDLYGILPQVQQAEGDVAALAGLRR